MLLEIDNFDQFKIFFDVVYDITEFVELVMFKTHMTCSILDKGHVRFMSVTYKKEFFSVYEVEDAESVTLFADDLHKIIKSAGKIDNVILETNNDYLICRLESRNGNSRVFEFVLPSEYIESPQPPSISLPVTFELGLDDLKQGINDLKVIGTDLIKFNVTNGAIHLTAGTEVTTNYISTIPTNVDTDDKYSSMFSLSYIEQLLKFNKISNTGEFSMGDNFPLVYSFEDEVMGVKVNGLIAPRVEVDDNGEF